MTAVTFEEFLAGLQNIRDHDKRGAEPLLGDAKAAADALVGLPKVDRESLAQLVRMNPEWVPLLGSCINLSKEQLKSQLRHHAGCAGWISLARREPEKLIAVLDSHFGLVSAIAEQRNRPWGFADVLAERVRWSQRIAAGSVDRGRRLEDVAEGVLRELNLTYEMRTRFVGLGGQVGSCDLAIPAGMKAAQIVCAVKGFDSTGSKLTDALREIKHMADVRLPQQYVYAFVDGIGWNRRQSDLRGIYELFAAKRIDGLYSLARLDAFRSDLRTAAYRLNLLPS